MKAPANAGSFACSCVIHGRTFWISLAIAMRAASSAFAGSAGGCIGGFRRSQDVLGTDQTRCCLLAADHERERIDCDVHHCLSSMRRATAGPRRAARSARDHERNAGCSSGQWRLTSSVADGRRRVNRGDGAANCPTRFAWDSEPVPAVQRSNVANRPERQFLACHGRELGHQRGDRSFGGETSVVAPEAIEIRETAHVGFVTWADLHRALRTRTTATRPEPSGAYPTSFGWVMRVVSAGTSNPRTVVPEI